jgi:Holliday junction resolvasome RuvABC endonuclease subunit
MEGVSYGSTGSAALVDLSGLNFSIRMMLIEESVTFNILAPTAVKKFAVGNGAADKNVMIASWKKLDKTIENIEDIKVDDLADSYFIAHFNVGNY